MSINALLKEASYQAVTSISNYNLLVREPLTCRFANHLTVHEPSPHVWGLPKGVEEFSRLSPI